MSKRITLGRRRRKRGPKQVARALIRELPNLFKLVFRLVRDPRVPRFDKILLGAVAVYMLTPADLIPDFLGVFGWVDDFYLLGLALSRLLGAAGPDALLRHWDGSPATLGYFVEGVAELGSLLPGNIQRGLQGLSRNPSRLRRRRGIRRIRVDEDATVHVEE
ncbi:MAG: DUF1232 domain-containing protein [Gemmatimonadota bacterium]